MNKNVELTISNTLKNLGINPSLLGYDYLKFTIKQTMQNKSLVHNITKELYPMVAKAFNTTCSRVERAMRHAIERAWDFPIIDARQAIFGCTISPICGKPTNGCFIATVSDYLTMTQEQEAN